MTPPNQPFRTELIHRTCTKEMLLQPAELCNVSLFVCDCLRLLLRSPFNHHNCSAVWEEGHTFADFYLCREIWILNYRLCGFFFFPRHLSLTASRMHSVFSSRMQRSSFSRRSWCLSFMARVCVVTSFVCVVGLSEPGPTEEKRSRDFIRKQHIWV